MTHSCNLNCIYCYESKKDKTLHLDFNGAIKIINDILGELSDDVEGVEFCFIGGEPLLEFGLMKEIVEYVSSMDPSLNVKYVFSATTNGTILTSEMKKWFKENKDKMILCLSLDGDKKTQDYNRDGSYDKIDFDFFLSNYPEQGVKMTISEYSISRLADNIKFIHSLGFKRINGVNIFEGDFDFTSDEYVNILSSQLQEIVDYYSLPENKYLFNQLFDKSLELMESENRRHRKNCGIGEKGVTFYDVDGKKYPCVMCTPMTLCDRYLRNIKNIDFLDESNFIDFSCNDSCYIYPICSNCSGSNYIKYQEFSRRDKRRCRIKN